MKTISFVVASLFIVATFSMCFANGVEVDQRKNFTKDRSVQDNKGLSPSLRSAKPTIADSVLKPGNRQNQSQSNNLNLLTSAAVVSVDENDLITAEIDNRPLQEVVQLLSEKRLCDLKGMIPPGEAITVRFTELSLAEALKKIMRGYNYVLLNQPHGQKPVLMIMGRAERSKPSDIAAIVTPIQPQPQAVNPTNSYVPPNTLLDRTQTGQTESSAKSSPENQPRPRPSPSSIPVTSRGPRPVQAEDNEAAKRAADAGSEGRPLSSGLQEGKPHQINDQNGQISN